MTIGQPEAPDDLFRDRVRERDLDNFLVEELHASERFLEWFIGGIRSTFSEPPGCSIRIQKSPPRTQDRRQTDVRIGWFDREDGLRACVLVESKVTADFQPGQAEAYAAEAAALRADLGGDACRSILVAPARKLGSLRHDGAFDAEVAIEDMVAFIENRRTGAEDELDLRLQARIQLLEALCGRRAASAWIGGTVPEKRDFADAYAELAAELLPNLSVRPSNDGPKAITRIFEKLQLGALPPATLRHEFGSGVGWKYANVQFSAAAPRLDALRRSGILDGSPYEVEPAGKSLAIRVRTPSIDPTRPFEEQRAAVEDGLQAIGKLVGWLQEHSSAIAQVLRGDH